MNFPLPPPQVLHPLSSVQREIWFEQNLYPDTPIYNVGGYNLINEAIAPEVFAQAIALLVRENEVLRLVLSEHDGVPLQSFPEMPQVELAWCDCSDEGDPLRAALSGMQHAIERPFRLVGEPLFRYTLYKLSAHCFFWSHTYHHLVVDGWAASLITQRVAALYNALVRGEQIPVRPGTSYLDFVENDAAYLGSASFDRQRDYWQQKFATLPEPLLIPKAACSTSAGIVAGAVHTWFLPRAQYAAIEALAQANSVSSFHVLLGLLYVYFTRVGDRDECVIGLPVLNRNTPAFKQTIGLFASMIPARFIFGRDTGFVELIQGIARTLRESYRYQRFPVSEINRLAGVLQAGRTRLFDLALSFEKHDYAARFGIGKPCNTIMLNHGFEQTPLNVFVREYSAAQDIQVDFSYNQAYFDADDIGRVEQRFRCLLGDALLHPERTIGTLEILPPDERQQLLVDWNDTALTLPHRCIHQLFEAQVLAAPEATAVVFETQSLSYAELNRHANQLAHRLIGLGVVPDSLVAIALERSPDMIVALLAVLKAGGAYVPLDPDYPAERLAFMLEDSGARILITSEALRQKRPLPAEHVLCLDAESKSLAAEPGTNPDRPVAREHLAYLIYTSGSTGKPKGVAVEHGSIARHCHEVQVHFDLTPADRVLQFASLSFDASVEQIFPTVCTGATLVLAAHGLNSAEVLDQSLRQHRVSVAHLPPAFFEHWLLQKRFRLTDTSLRLLQVGGDVLPNRLLSTWFAALQSNAIRLLNGYGPTEATVTTTYYDIPETLAGTSVPIGRPLPSRKLYVLDRHGQPTPIGVPGELHIGGAGLARGYHNRPELTAEKFIADPFSEAPGARLYKTGDLVRYRADGNLEFLGRIDHQVKIRGFRIELGEIEAAIAAHPAIGEVVIIARADATGDTRLLAYLVASTAEQPSIAELRALLKVSLPDYMIPAAFVFLETLPLTPNGKVDRKALPDPEWLVDIDAHETPLDALDEIVAGLWASVLGLSSVGLRANFFELGGHSLLATQLASRLRDALDLAVPVRWLFEAPTVLEFADRIRSALAGEGELSAIVPANRIVGATTRITPDLLPLIDLAQGEIDAVLSTVEGGAGNVQDIYPLAPLQQGILFHHRLQRSGDAYLSHALLAFDSATRRQSFITALQSVVDRHDILRTAFVWERLAEPVQVVWRHAALPVDVRRVDPADGPIAEQLLESCTTRLDLTRAPLLRIEQADDGERRLLLLRFHHLIMDHTTLEVMLEEIAAQLQGETAKLAPPVPFRNFVAQARNGVSQASHEAFFRAMLGDIETPTAPFGLLDVQGDGSTIVEARRDLPADLALRLRRVVRRLGATPAALCHLAWALVLSRCCGEERIVFGTVLFGRMQGGEGVERALGLFINTLPLRIDCDARPVAQALRETQHALLALMRHEHASLSLAQRCSAVAHPAPLFSALLNYRHSPVNGDGGSVLDGVELLHAKERTNYPFFLSVDDLDDGFSLTAQVDASIDPQRIGAFMQRAIEALVDAIEHAPQTPLSSLDILPADERKQLLVGWNDTATPLAETCVHQLFEAQVLATPEASAVVFNDETLSYAELNRRANQLARRLIALGVVPDSLVAIVLERSPDMIVALLAVLKAGGAYVPLDPDYPDERLAFMLEDCAAQILITSDALQHKRPLRAEHVLCLDAELLAAEPATNPNRPVAPEDLAYVIYTSGSTGRPKGVAMPHRPLYNLIAWQLQNTPEVRANTLQYTTLSFDVSFQEIVCTLAGGGCLFLIEDDVRRDSVELLRLIDAHRIARLFMPYVALADLCETASRAGIIPHALRAVFTAGEQLRIVPSITALFEKTGASLHNQYGPTESHVATAFDLGHEAATWPAFPPIGRPIANTQLYVLDRHGEPTPIGVPGELYIGGVGLARGYHNRPELTAEKFIADPFSEAPGARLYRTGDLVRYRADGNLEFLGRIDHQVKIRGFRIELGEIEAALANHPALRELVVIARADATGDMRLLAYLVAATDERPGVPELRAFLKVSLPDYMLPAAFVFLDALPLTPDGKVDRKALPDPEWQGDVEKDEAPRDALEEIVAGLWASVLGISSVGLRANFFELGGHSLLATQLVSRLRDAFTIAVPVRWLFEAPTVLELAERIRSARTGENTDEGAKTDGDELAARAIVPVPRDLPLPLSFAQQRLWFIDQLEGASAAYNMPGVLELAGDLDVAALRSALSEIVRRHESLRTHLVAPNGEPLQVIAPASPLLVPLIDLRDRDDPDAEARRLAEGDAATPFDLASNAPLRVKLLQRHESAWTLLVTLHHSAADGWSITLLIRELIALYAAFHAGKPSPLPELPIQYADFALWQRQYLAGERLVRQLAVWRARLAGAPECLTLPTDRPRPARPSHRGASLAFVVDAELTTGLRSLSRRAGATLFMTLLGAWATLLARYSGEDDIVIGSPVANRTQSAIEPLIGFFVNTLALRADLSGNPSFIDLLARLRQTCLEAYAHQEIPFESLVESLGIPRNLAHSPLFQVMFVLQNNAHEDLVLPGLEVAFGGGESAVAKFDLTLTVAEVNGTLDASLEYATDLFDHATIARLAAQFTTLLRALVDHPERSVGTLDILPPDERQQLLVEWNDTATPLPETCVHRLFEAQVEATPEASAVVFEDETLSYAELNRRANQLAHRLIALGVVPESLVAIALERSPAMIVALVAVLKAGGAYVPLDPGYPAERLAFMLADSGARILITTDALQPPLSAEHVLRLDLDSLAGQAETNPNRRVVPEDLAYVIYTSGSTGKPKGVAGTHRATVNRIAWMQDAYPFVAGERCAQKTSLNFVDSVWEIFAPLASGVPLVILRATSLEDPRRLVAALAEYGVTRLVLVPSLLRVVLDEVADLAACLSRLRVCVSSGEALPADLARRFRQALPRTVLLNLYGSTEVAGDATCGQVIDPGERVAIGRPIANTQAYVLDRHGEPTPIGVPGELHIGGAGLARGYHNRTELTAEKFIADPFSEAPGAQLYRTGDLVRYRADGNLEFLGRIDHQVKIRGFRIELGEIEAALVSHPALREVVVIARADATGDMRLFAYLVASNPGHVPTVADLRAFLKASLPDYMLPAAFVFLDTLPLTPNGKVDRKALPDPQTQVDSPTDETPRDAPEEIVTGLWASVLGRSSVGLRANFFELGGHSLLATQLASRLRDAFTIAVPVRWLFESPTVLELAERIRSALAADAADPSDELAARAIVPVPRDRSLPLSFAQQRLWFIDQLEGASATYNIPGVLELTGSLDVEALRSALSEIVRRHESLRTRLVAQHGEPVQVIAPASPLPLPLVDLRVRVDPDEDARALARDEALIPFDLAHDAPLRARLLQRHESAWTLLVTLHHSAADGWSITLLIRELIALYTALRDGLPSPLPELPIQYADFALWQRTYLAGERLDRLREVWHQRLAGAPKVLNLPTDRPRPARPSHRGASLAFVVDAEVTTGLQSLSRHAGATLFMTLLAALATLLARYSGDDDIVIGSPVANRTQSAIEPLIGFFVNTLALRADLSGDPSFIDLLGRLRQTCLDAYAHQEIPFESLVESLGIPRNLAHSPLFQVMFVLQNNAQHDLVLPGLEVTFGEAESTVAKFDLTLSIAEKDSDSTLAASIEYATDLFDHATIERLAAQFAILLRAIVDHPERSLGTLEILPNEERQQLLVEWNNTALTLPHSCIHQMFEAQVLATPEATAVVFEDETFSYAQLNSRANQLAHRLIALGVDPDALVAIALERSPEMIVALLAVLKAGGAYVPLDPDYPAERLVFMLEDCGARILITTDALQQRQPLPAEHVLRLDVDSLAGQPSTNPDRRVAPEHLAYLIYTSGSTGRPKGAMIEHRGLSNYLCWAIEAYGIEAGDCAPVHSSISFDLTVTSLYSPLLVGGYLDLLAVDPGGQSLLAALRRGIDHGLVKITPAHLELIGRQLTSDEIAQTAGAFVIGGENLLAESLAPWRRYAPSTRLINEYGPTETVVGCCVYEVQAHDPIGGSVPIGRPIANTRLYVLDRHLQIVPIGVAGELHIGGAGLARGYLNLPELTAEKFIADPFSKAPGARLYKTGDLVRYRADGNLEFLGRIDHQVKIRGFRIELGEIEAALSAHPVIREVVVIARADATGDTRLLAYLVAVDSANAPSVAELRAFLKVSLPDHMIPAAFVFLEVLPLTPNGKVDRKILPEPDAQDPQDDYVAPRDALEQQLVLIWEGLLARRPIGIGDDYFEIGGHSLLAVRLIAEIDARFGKRLPVSRLFEYPTIAGIASLLRQEGELPDASCLVGIRAQGSRPPLFFVPGAGGVVSYLYPLAQQLDPERPFFAFQAQGLEGNSAPHASIEAMAEHYVALLLEVQPRGPYFLAGHSFGAQVAFAMAQVLLAQGQTIGLLAIADAYAPGAVPGNEAIADDSALLLDIAELLTQLFDRRTTFSRDDLAGLDDEQQLGSLARRFEAAGLLPQGGGAEHLRRLLSVYKAHLQMHVDHAPQNPRPIPMALFRASEATAGQAQNLTAGDDYGWGRYSSGPVRVHDVPGDHLSMMTEPHVGKLAQVLGESMA